MYRANFRSVFIGIETPRLDSLKETRSSKTSAGDSLEAKLARIQNAGLDINAGFIVGFDSDDQDVFEDQFRFIQANGITLAMVGVLQAIPTHAALRAAATRGATAGGRIRLQLHPQANEPGRAASRLLEPGPAAVRSGSVPGSLFQGLPVPRNTCEHRAEICRKAGEGKCLPTLAYGLVLLWSLFWALLRDGSLISVGKIYLKYFFTRNLRYRRDVVGFAQFMNRCVTHWHFYKFTREVTSGRLKTYHSV